MTQSPLNIGLIGLGTVGSQVAERMLTWQSQLARRAGVELCLRRVLVRDLTKRRSVEIDSKLITADPSDLLDDPDVHVIVEVAGGNEPMRGYLERAIRAGKHVVTANKVVMAKHGPDLLDLAAEKNVDVYFEAAVGGGIPLISTFRTDLQANRIERLSAVINGTTNYVLGRMAAGTLSLDEAVREAQAAGYAEADPTDDVGGFDATYKLAILGSIAYEIKVRPDDIYREGIEGIEPVDFRYARELGYAIKLIAHTQRHPGRIEARVHPAMVPLDHPLAQVEGANNAVFVEGDLVGQVLLVGQGAGGRPTASAVVGDLIDRARTMAVTPIVAGAALKGPTVEMLQGLGREATATGIARGYHPYATTFVLDHRDAAEAAAIHALGYRVALLDTVMVGPEGRRRLAEELILL